LQRTAKKCTKFFNARAQLLFCSLNLLFCDILVAVVVVVCLSSLLHPLPLVYHYVKAVYSDRTLLAFCFFLFVPLAKENTEKNHLHKSRNTLATKNSFKF